MSYYVDALSCVFDEILVGDANGVDGLVTEVGRDLEIPVKVFKADWEKHGKAAGPIRNREMIAEADGLVAIWNGKSRGTQDAVRQAKKKGIPVTLITITVDDIL